MTSSRHRHSSGFTLIELIVVIVILGIISIFGTFFLVNMVKSYMWATDNAHLTQKAQVALTRIAVETAYADSASVVITGNTITYNATYPDEAATSNQIKLDSSDPGRLVLVRGGDDHVLTDRVTSFTVSEDHLDDGYFTVTLTMTGANNAPQTFTKTIALPEADDD